MSDSSKPKWHEDDAVRRGRDAHHLAGQYRPVVEPRLAAGTIDGLGADIDLLSASGSDRMATRIEQKGRTGKKRDLGEDGEDWVMTVRSMARRTGGIGAGVLKALGVGERVDPKSAKQVIAAIEACLRTFEEDPSLLGTIGLLEQDLTDARSLLTDLDAAGAGQASVMMLGKDKTFDRNVVQMRIEAAVDMISSRGRMAFRNEADVRARFEALVSSGPPSATVKEDPPEPTA